MSQHSKKFVFVTIAMVWIETDVVVSLPAVEMSSVSVVGAAVGAKAEAICDASSSRLEAGTESDKQKNSQNVTGVHWYSHYITES